MIFTNIKSKYVNIIFLLHSYIKAKSGPFKMCVYTTKQQMSDEIRK